MDQSLINLLQSNIDFAIGHTGETITYLGNPYQATISDISNGEKTEIDGLVSLYDLVIRVSKNTFTVEPENGNEITVRNRTFKIENHSETADGLEWIINCMGGSTR